MNFEILKRAETQFREIADFYVKWNAEPENIIPFLVGHPSTKRLMDNNVKVREQFALQKIKKEGGISGPSTDTKLANGQWLGVKLKQVLPEPYKLSGLDVWRYIYFARIVPRDEGITAFCNELDAVNNEAEERGQIRWCQKFFSLLNGLSDQLTTLDNMPLRSRPKPDGYEEWSESYGNVRWYDIDQTLQDLANKHIRPLIDQYQSVINDCSINLPATDSQNKSSDNQGTTPTLSRLAPAAINVKGKPRQPKRQHTLDKDFQTLTYFRQQVRTGIGDALRLNQEPDQKQILKVARESTIKRQMISGEKLRKDIKPLMQAELFGKIYRDESELKKQSAS